MYDEMQCKTEDSLASTIIILVLFAAVVMGMTWALVETMATYEPQLGLTPAQVEAVYHEGPRTLSDIKER
jgi:hypothetical protein